MTTLSNAPFPAVTPTARGYNPGNWPVRSYVSQNGTEVRILYGDTETGTGLSLSYENLPDAQAQLFLDHYRAVLGTYMQFHLNSSGNVNAKGGWDGDTNAIGKPQGTYWRYAGPPTIQQVGPGISSVNVDLVAVL